MRTALALVAVALACAGCAGREAPLSQRDLDVQVDIRRLAEQIETTHPNPFHTRGQAEWRRAVDDLVARVPELHRDEILVELMRLAALGPRDGHAGLYPLAHDHARPLHLYPLRLWSFADGLHVVGSLSHPELVGLRLVSIAGRPSAEIAEAVRPLVAHDNASSLALRVPEFMITAEVLHGLRLIEAAGPARFVFARRDGSTLERTLAPVSATEYVGRAVGSHQELWAPPPPPFGDRVAVALPALGWTVYVASQYVEVVRGDRRAAVPPDVPVPLSAAAYFAGRDPVLERALR